MKSTKYYISFFDVTNTQRTLECTSEQAQAKAFNYAKIVGFRNIKLWLR